MKHSEYAAKQIKIADLPCQYKRAYKSGKIAKTKAKEYKKKFGTKQYSYKCPYCLNYHLTKTRGLKHEQN